MCLPEPSRDFDLLVEYCRIFINGQGNRINKSLQSCVARKQGFLEASGTSRETTVPTAFQAAGRRLSPDPSAPSIHRPLPAEGRDRS